MPLPTVTDSSFDTEVYQSDIPVWVDFGSEWCAPCKQIEPSLIALECELKDRLKVFKVDVDTTPNVAMNLGVRGISALFVFRDGKVSAHRTGAASKQILQTWLEASISS
ncbi:thioredoxin domain-containing protein [uncultured Litoreibacter sp.]|uniref:thioredoxin family protein n=1 Tax=uncultured Litoreibacter sp. TaxID=1392394 RepID=UPI00260CBBD6|nr:thioredoxin domain-containing protein [uncultured Litoreibacter sp.]